MTKDVHTATKRQITSMQYDTLHCWPKHTGDFLKSIMYENDSSQQTPIHIPMNVVRYIKPTCNTFYNCENDAYMLFGDNHSHLDMHNARTEWLWNSSLSCKINYPSSMNQLFCRIESIRWDLSFRHGTSNAHTAQSKKKYQWRYYFLRFFFNITVPKLYHMSEMNTIARSE